MLEERHQPYILAVRSNHHLRHFSTNGFIGTGPATIAADLPLDAWAMLAAGEGTKGPRLYDWAQLKLPWTVEDGLDDAASEPYRDVTSNRALVFSRAQRN